jgi:hypothetical protein
MTIRRESLRHPVGPRFIFILPDTKNDPETDHMEVSTIAIELLLHQLGYIAQQLQTFILTTDSVASADSSIILGRPLHDWIDWVAFYHEDFLFREYAVRERILDLLMPVLGLARPNQKKQVFKAIADYLPTRNKRLYESYIAIARFFDRDTNIRNIITHEGFLALVLVSEFTQSASDEDPFPDVIVLSALRDFVAKDLAAIQEFISLASAFVTTHKESLATPDDLRDA